MRRMVFEVFTEKDGGSTLELLEVPGIRFIKIREEQDLGPETPGMIDAFTQDMAETVHIGGIRGDIPRSEFDQLEPLDLEEEGVVSKQITQLEEALPDPDKLELLAFWFDRHDAATGNSGTEVQDDLREWARKIREVKT